MIENRMRGQLLIPSQGEHYIKRNKESSDDDEWDSDEEEHRTFFACSAEFSHMSDGDKAVAIFKFERPQEACLDLFQSIMNDYTRKLWWNSLEEEPHHYVRIRQEVNDTIIHGISVDWETCEISCDWRQTLTSFYQEDKLYHKLLAAWTKEKEMWAKNLGDQAAKGEANMEDTMLKAFSAFAGASDECLKKARRARFWELLRKDPEHASSLPLESFLENFPFNEETETKILKTIKTMKFYGGFEDDSDDEDGELGSDYDSEEWIDDDDEGDGNEAGEDKDEDDIDEYDG